MNISLQKEDLVYAVSAVERAVSGKNTLPILGGILISAAEGMLSFRATDLELAMECRIQADIIEEGEVVVPGRKFSAIVRLLPNGTVRLVEEQDKVQLQYEGGRQSVPCYDAEEFPVLPTAEGEICGSIPVGVFRRMVRQASIAAAADEVRPVFTGVFTELEDGSMTMVATDTHRLAWVNGGWQGQGSCSLLIPGRTLQEVARLAVNDDDSIQIMAGKSQVFFSFANLTFMSRLIVGQYPDYHQVIPAEDSFGLTAAVNKNSFVEVLERAFLISRDGGKGRSNAVKLAFSGDQLEVSAEVPDEGTIREVLPVTMNGEEISVYFNARYLLDVLKVISTEQIVIKLSGANTPGIILPDESEKQYLYLLLPVRVSNRG